jgi:hypothetical protein
MLGLSTLHLPPAIPAFFVNIAADLVPVFKAIRQQNFLAAFFGPLRFFRETFGRHSMNPPVTVIYSAVPTCGAVRVRNYCHQLCKYLSRGSFLHVITAGPPELSIPLFVKVLEIRLLIKKLVQAKLLTLNDLQPRSMQVNSAQYDIPVYDYNSTFQRLLRPERAGIMGSSYLLFTLARPGPH